MPTFKYIGVDKNGVKIEGYLHAIDEHHLREEMALFGWNIQNITELSPEEAEATRQALKLPYKSKFQYSNGVTRGASIWKDADPSLRLIIILVFIFISVTGGRMIYNGIVDDILTTKKYEYHVVKTVPCIIKSCGLSHESGSKGGHSYWFKVRFSYELDGKKYTSDQYSTHHKYFRAAGPKNIYSTENKDLLEKYKPGFETVCFVNPKYPDKGILKIEPPKSYRFWLKNPIVIAYLIVVILTPILIIDDLRRRYNEKFY